MQLIMYERRFWECSFSWLVREPNTTAQDAMAQDAMAQDSTALDTTAHFSNWDGRYGTQIIAEILKNMYHVIMPC